MPALCCCMWALSGCGEQGLPSSCGARASLVVEHRLWPVGFSRCGSRALECGLSSCGAWTQLLHSMWNLPRPGINQCPLHCRWTLNHWTAREAPPLYILDVSHKHWGLPGSSTVKYLPPTMQETWIWTLGWKTPWRRAWQPIPVFLPGESHGQRSLAGYSPGGHKESDMTEQLNNNSKHWCLQFNSVQSLSRVRLFATPWIAARQASLSITNSWSLLKLMLVMPPNHLTLCHPLLLPPSIFPSIRVFSNESVLHVKWPKYWSFSFNISPSNEHPGLISFRMDCAVQIKDTISLT